MADDVIEAAARVIRILGEGALASSAGELARLAVELAGVDVGVDGVPRDNLRAAAAALSQADSARRSQAVLDLLDAATALEPLLGIDLNLLRSGTSDLARACSKHLETADDTDEVERAAAALEEERAAGPWLWLLLRGRARIQRHRHRHRHRHRDLETALLAEDPPPPPQAARERDGAAIAANLLRQELRKQAREKLFALARSTQDLAGIVGVAHADLDRAIDALALVGAENVRAAVAALGAAATQLELKATAQLRALRAPVAQLADACREHGEAADAMQKVQRAAEDRAQQRGNAAGGTIQNEQPAAPGPGNELSSACSAMQGTALLGALTMLPYMGGAEGLLKLKLCEYRRNVGVVFAWLWCIIGVGVPCLMARSPLLHLIARLLNRVGMLSLTLLVIFYCHWSLAPDWVVGLWILVAVTHMGLLVWACYKKDL